MVLRWIKSFPKRNEADLGSLTRTLSANVSLILAGFLSGVMMLGGCKKAEAPAPQTKVEPAPPIVVYDTLTAKVKVNESFNAIANNLGLAQKDASLLLSGIKANFKFKLYAGQLYQLVTKRGDSLPELMSFILEDRFFDRRHILAMPDSLINSESGVNANPQGLAYSVVEIPIRLDTVAVTGNLTTSLYEAFLSKGETPALITMVTKIFAWDIDFFKDPRIGDAFNLLVEKKFGEDGSFRGYGQVLSARYMNRGKDFYGILYKGAYFDENGGSLEKLLLKVPLNFAHISSGFSSARLHPILGVKRPHWGVDYAAPKGTKIFAAGDGTIEYAKWINGYGKTVKIRHNGVYNTYYAHLNGFAPGMSAGRRVHQGETIAYLGMTGLASGPHLDYRVEFNGKYINPTSLKMDAKEGVAKTEWSDFCSQRDSLMARMVRFENDHFASL